VTDNLTREQTITALRAMVRKLNAAVESNEWDLETVRILGLAEDITAWLDSRPRTWRLPAEPDCPVRDAEGWAWHRTSPKGLWVNEWGMDVAWSFLLTRGPLTEEKP
jgi:hypothetical protein